MLQIILLRAPDGQLLSVSGAPLFRERNAFLPGKILSCYAPRAGADILDTALCHNLTAVHARAGADVDNIIRRAHSFLVVFDNHKRISQIAEAFQRHQQLFVIALVQADGRFVQNIKHAHKRGADLCRKAYALAFSPGKASGSAGERQILKPDALEKLKPAEDFFEHAVGNERIPRV